MEQGSNFHENLLFQSLLLSKQIRLMITVDNENERSQNLVHPLLVFRQRILASIVKQYVDHQTLNLFTLKEAYVRESSDNVLLDASLKFNVGEVTVPIALQRM